MTDALSLFTSALVAFLGLAMFGLAAVTSGADSRESYGDDHRRSRGGEA